MLALIPAVWFGVVALLCPVALVYPADPSECDDLTVEELLSKIESVTDKVKTYDIVYDVVWCAMPVTGHLVSPASVESLGCAMDLAERFQDRWSYNHGRRIHWLSETGRPVAVALRLFEGRDSDALHETLGYLGAGQDFLSYLRPQLHNRALTTVLKEHPGTRLVRSPSQPQLLAAEIPFRELCEFHDLGVRLWCDTTLKFAPVRWDVFCRFGDREILTATTSVELAEVQPNLFVPRRGIYATVVGSIDPKTGTAPIRAYALTVKLENAKWNVPLSTFDFNSPLLGNRDFQIKRDLPPGSGWTLAVLKPGPIWNVPSAFQDNTRPLVVAVLAGVFFVLLIFFVWAKRHSPSLRQQS